LIDHQDRSYLRSVVIPKRFNFYFYHSIAAVVLTFQSIG
jgi:hypothetical protein